MISVHCTMQWKPARSEAVLIWACCLFSVWQRTILLQRRTLWW